MSKRNFFESLKFDFFNLDNGLQVIIVPIERIPLICINLFYKVGSKDEQIGKSGFAHLFEHLMFQGTKNIPNGEYDKLCSLGGGANNAMTSYDYTSYEIILPSNQLELGLWLESDRMFNFAIEEEAFNVQRNVVIEEIKETVYNVPYSKWREYLSKYAFAPESGYNWEVYGKIDDLLNSSLKDAREFYENYYQPNNCCLVVAGDIDLKVAKELTFDYFSRDKGKADIKIQRKKFSKDYLNSPIRHSLLDNVPHSAVFLSFHTSGLLTDEILAGDLISCIIGWGVSSRIYEQLVHNKNIASYAGAYLDKREHTSLISIYAVANHSDVSCDNLFDEIMLVIKKLKNNKITNQELKKAKNQVRTQLAHSLQYIAGIADMIGFYTIFKNDPNQIYRIMDMYGELDKTNLNDFIEKHLNEDNFVSIEISPQ